MQPAFDLGRVNASLRHLIGLGKKCINLGVAATVTLLLRLHTNARRASTGCITRRTAQRHPLTLNQNFHRAVARTVANLATHTVRTNDFIETVAGAGCSPFKPEPDSSRPLLIGGIQPPCQLRKAPHVGRGREVLRKARRGQLLVEVVRTALPQASQTGLDALPNRVTDAARRLEGSCTGLQ